MDTALDNVVGRKICIAREVVVVISGVVILSADRFARAKFGHFELEAVVLAVVISESGLAEGRVPGNVVSNLASHLM